MPGRKILRAACLGALLACTLAGATRRVLYFTRTDGFRHEGSIDASALVMQDLAAQSGVLQIVHTEDLSQISAENLRNFDAVYFFTSGELPFTDQQKADLLDFVRQGKGFGGSHSATDTLYTWPEYGEMIGGVFDGHPWTQQAIVDVEDPENPIVKHMAPAFSALEEFYQFREFSRDRVRVLLTLDTRSVNLDAEGVNRKDADFALVWIRKYGQGRVFYSAFGHFDQNFRLPVFRTMLLNALLWLTGEIEADATPRSGPGAPPPSLTAVSKLDGASDVFAPGAILAITGERLTSGSSLDGAGNPLPVRLAGTHVEVDGRPAPLFSVTPGKVITQLPADLTPGAGATLTVASVNRASAPVMLRIEAAAPAILAATRAGGVLVLYATGLGATEPGVDAGIVSPFRPLARTRLQPAVRIAGRPAEVQFSGLAPGLVGVYQVNAAIPDGVSGTVEVVIECGGFQSAVFTFGL
jgi:uncharacterized protein (TIGR03437 family)